MNSSQTLHQRRGKVGWMAGLLLVGWCLLASLSDARAQTAGQVDPTFGASLGLLGNVRTVTMQPDGKMLVAGGFTRGIARLNADGSTDTAFSGNVGYIGAQQGVTSMAVQADGKIVLGGLFYTVDGVSHNCLARLNADGTLDTTFNASADVISTVNIQADGKILVGGGFTQINGSVRKCLARLNTDGSLDTTFNVTSDGGPNAVAVQNDGKIVLGGSFTQINGLAHNNVARLNTDGNLDSTFNTGTDDVIFSIAVQNDGKTVLVGRFTLIGGATHYNIARINVDGSLDTAFNVGAIQNEVILSASVQTDGKIVLGGYFTQIDGVARSKVARVNADGSLDTGFNASADVNVSTTIPLVGGKIILGGSFTQVNGVGRSSIARVNADGSVDAGFVADLVYGPNASVSSSTVQADGKVLLRGIFTQVSGITHNYIARLNADGGPDAAFNVNLTQSSASNVCTVVQTDGKIILGGYFSQVNGVASANLARLNADGTLDTTFSASANDGVYTIALQTNGQMIVGGHFYAVDGAAHSYLARLKADGSLDTAFNASTDGTVCAATVQGDGKIVIGGYFRYVNGAAHYGIARLNSDGTSDTTFSASINQYYQVYSIAVQSNGQIVIGGYFYTVNGVSRNNVARLNTDGTLDASFTADSNNIVNTVAIQPDGKILLAGNFAQINGTARNNVARLNADGTLDTTYNPSVAAHAVNNVTAQKDGKALISGSFTQVNGTVRNYVARLNADGTTDSGFNPGAGAPSVMTLGLQSGDGKVVVGGNFTSAGGQPANALARLRTDGSLDPTFTAPFSPGDTVPALALQTDGNIVVSQLTPDTTSPRPALDSQGHAVIGPHTDTKIKNPIVRCSGLNGSLDASFSTAAATDGTANSLSVQANGQIVVGGSFTALNTVSGHPNLGRLNADGPLDTAFTATTNAAVQVVLAQSDGHIAVGGLFTQVNATAHPGLARLNADGTLDATFSSTAGTDGAVLALALQSDGKLVAGGSFANASGQPRSCLARFNANGTLDTAFNPGAITRAGGGAQVSSVAQQADGKLVIAGLFSQVGTSTRNNVARLNTDGSVDTTFDPSGGPNAIVRALALQPDGRTLLGGDFTSVNSVQRNAAARLLGDYNLNDYPPLGQWRIVNFGSPSTTGNSADTATPYNDGVPNLLKYALNLNAQRADDTAMTASGTKGLPLVGRDATGQYLTLTFVRRQAATSPGITYLVEFSNGLSASGGFAVNPSATSTATTLDSTWERVTVTDSVPRSQQSARFVRLRVTDP